MDRLLTCPPPVDGDPIACKFREMFQGSSVLCCGRGIVPEGDTKSGLFARMKKVRNLRDLTKKDFFLVDDIQ